MSNQKINAELLKRQTIGVEVEMSKISRESVAKIVADYFYETYGLESYHYYDGSHHSNWIALGKERDGVRQRWQMMTDGSSPGDWGSITCELVTPILHYDDIPDLQAIVRLLRKAGARSGVHYNAGVHIHVGADFDREGGQTAKSIRNLVNLIASHERLLCDACAVSPERQRQWARFVEPSFLRDINRRKPTTKEELERLWYGYTGHHSHYDSTRYHLLNLHAIWDKGTIEFRCFEFHNNLHAGELKAWIQLCLAMCSYAKLISFCSPRPHMDLVNPKYTLKNWLCNMGLIGDEFKTCRKMLTKHLRGDAGYKNGRPVAEDLDDLRVDTLITDDVVVEDSRVY